jgi:branched-chain amino acid transport system permease protein
MSAAERGWRRGAFDILPRLWPLLALATIIAVIAISASFAPAVLQRRTTQGLINLIAVVGLYVFVGNSGVLSFGNVAFMAIGAYVSALLTMKSAAKSVFLPDLPAVIAHAEWPTLAGALAGGTAAALVALVIAAPAGTGDVILALIMLLIILLRPDGISAGRELTWPLGRS